MADMNPKRHVMPCLAPEERKKNFSEVTLGYDEETAVAEAKRCLKCKNKPCTQGCPVNIRIPEFIEKVANREFEAAYDIIRQSSALPAVCGRVCPQETQCEGRCVRGFKGESVGIGRLERFVADYCKNSAKPEKAEPNGKKVAVIGSGPSGLTCAGELAKGGCDVTVFEALHIPGGVLVYGIPEFRLPKKIVNSEIDTLRAMGVKFVTNAVIGKSMSVDELFAEEGFSAVFIGTGAGLPRFMGIPGENLKGVYSANEFLTRVNLMKAYEENSSTPIIKAEQVCVIGGGNVAMDAARCALRLGAKNVRIVYRRSLKELPARAEEVENAFEEGIGFNLLTNPVEILSDENNFVRGVKCVKMELGEPDSSGRRSPVEIAGSEFEIEAQSVIVAIGTSPNPLIKNTTPGIEINKRGGIVVNEDEMTTKSGVYAGGDAVTGAATVILAMGAGKKAAKSILEQLAKQ